MVSSYCPVSRCLILFFREEFFSRSANEEKKQEKKLRQGFDKKVNSLHSFVRSKQTQEINFVRNISESEKKRRKRQKSSMSIIRSSTVFLERHRTAKAHALWPLGLIFVYPFTSDSHGWLHADGSCEPMVDYTPTALTASCHKLKYNYLLNQHNKNRAHKHIEHKGSTQGVKTYVLSALSQREAVLSTQRHQHARGRPCPSWFSCVSILHAMQ